MSLPLLPVWLTLGWLVAAAVLLLLTWGANKVVIWGVKKARGRKARALSLVENDVLPPDDLDIDARDRAA